MRIDTDAGPAGRMIGDDAARGGCELEWILGIDAALDGVPLQFDVALAQCELLAGGDADLLLHQVDAGDEFGHGMFDLQAGVHLDEVELAILVEKLEGACASIADLAAGFRAAIADARDEAAGDIGCRSLLDDLLVAALHGTIPFAQPDRVLVGVGQHLKLDMSRIFQELFHVDHRIAKGGLRLGASHGDRVEQGRLGMHDAHAAPAAAAGRLDDDRVADGAGDLDDFLRVFRQRALGSWDAGHTGDLHGVLGGDLVAHQADGFGPRADEHEAGLLDPLREIGVFREEAVTRVDRLGIRHLCRRNDGRDVEVAGRGGRRPYANGLVGELDVLRLGVRFRMDDYGFNAQFAAGALDAEGDFPSIGNENFLEHGFMGK